jgi:hypothetical protein
MPELVVPDVVSQEIMARALSLSGRERPLLLVAGSRAVSESRPLPFNKSEVFTGDGELLFAQRKNYRFQLPEEYVTSFALDVFDLRGGEVEAISVPGPAQLVVADLQFARMAVLMRRPCAVGCRCARDLDSCWSNASGSPCDESTTRTRLDGIDGQVGTPTWHPGNCRQLARTT